MTQPRRPHAVIDHAALRANAARILATGEDTADLRADAYGHGLVECATTVTAAGMRVLVADRDDACRLSDAGIPGIAVTVGLSDRSADACALLGMPGGPGTPVMSLHGSLLSIKPLLAGEGVSYGYIHRAPQDTTVGLVAGGYAQGVVREVGSRVDVRVHGRAAAIVGRVAMDACVVDLGDGDAVPGDDVLFFGDPGAGAPSLAAWTAVTGLSGLEIVSLAGVRVTREHVR